MLHGIHRRNRMAFYSELDVAARLRAMALHFLLTLAVAAMAAVLVFVTWFPNPFDQMLGGLELFLLILACDLVLGPLISLVIYNRRKPRGELVRDYLVVGAVQLAALLYGMNAVMAVRPAFIVFAVDRFEVVSAGEMAPQDLQQGSAPQWRRLPWTGPLLTWAEQPPDPKEKSDLLFSSFAGKDLQHYPRYYRDYDAGRSHVLAKAQPLDALLEAHPEARNDIEAAVTRSGKPRDQLRWLPVSHARGFWTVMVDSESAMPLQWLALDPY